MMVTAFEFAASFGRRKPTQQEVKELHRLREQDFDALAKKDAITVGDIQALEWGVKFEVANKLFDHCDETAKHALLHDQHHAVRAAAQLFKRAEKAVTPVAETTAPVGHMTVAEVALVIMNGKQRIATLSGMKTAAGIEDMIASALPVSVLSRAESFIAGFEGDDLQEGVDQLLADLRAALKAFR